MNKEEFLLELNKILNWIDNNYNTDIAEFTEKLQIEISKSFSFQLPVGKSNPIVYCGLVEDGVPAYKIIDALCDKEGSAYGYISNTDAGKFINNDKFFDKITKYFGSDAYDTIFNGNNGQLEYINSTGNTVKVLGLNDYLSQNYAANIVNSDLKTFLVGDATQKAWSRVEFPQVLKMLILQL